MLVQSLAASQNRRFAGDFLPGCFRRFNVIFSIWLGLRRLFLFAQSLPLAGLFDKIANQFLRMRL
jgi:hypothetical protein